MTQTIDDKAYALLLKHSDTAIKQFGRMYNTVQTSEALAALAEALTRIEELEGKLEIRKANQETPRYVLAAQEPDDVLYPRALEILDGNEFISCSMLQRALQIGYNRACRFIEKMEEAGLVSAHEGYGKYRNLARATLTKGIKE